MLESSNLNCCCSRYVLLVEFFEHFWNLASSDILTDSQDNPETNIDRTYYA